MNEASKQHLMNAIENLHDETGGPYSEMLRAWSPGDDLYDSREEADFAYEYLAQRDAETRLAWWRIGRPNSDAVYGYGTEDHARRYANILDGDDPGGINCYMIEECDESESRALSDGMLEGGFDLDCEVEVLASMEARS